MQYGNFIDDVEKIKKAKDELVTVSQKLGEAVYKASQAKPGPEASAAGGQQEAPQPGSAGKKEDVVDAEVVDEAKKL